MYKWVKGSSDSYYFGDEEYKEYGELVRDALSGQTVSKAKSDFDKDPIGLGFNAERLGFDDPITLLRTLEGLCYNGEAVEIDDSTYRVL